MFSAALLSALLLQTPAAPPPAAPVSEGTAVERAAQAAERAAQAAEHAAEANARVADAIQQLAQQLAPGAVPAPVAPAAPAAPAPPAAPAKPSEGDHWDVTVGTGLIFITGNASTVTLNGLATAQRKTEGWIYAAQASGVYGESRAPTLEGEEAAPTQVVALNAALQLRADRRFTPQLSGYVLGRGETDHIKSVEFRGSGEVGLGIIWWDQKRADGSESFLRTDIALSYARETRFQYYPTRTDIPDVSLGGPHVGLSLRHGLTQDVALVEELGALPSLLDGSRLLASNQTQLNVRLTRSLAIATTFLVLYDSRPAAGKLTTDTSLSVSASVTF